MRSSFRLFRAALAGLVVAGLSGCGLFSRPTRVSIPRR